MTASKIGERQRIFSSVFFVTCSQCQILYCYTYDFISAGATQGELPEGQERVLWRIPVLRNSLARCNTRHLRIKRLVQFTFADPIYNNVLKNRAALLCRACGDPPICVAERYLTLRIRGYMSARSASLRKKKSSAVPLFSQRSHVGNLRQTKK